MKNEKLYYEVLKPWQSGQHKHLAIRVWSGEGPDAKHGKMYLDCAGTFTWQRHFVDMENKHNYRLTGEGYTLNWYGMDISISRKNTKAMGRLLIDLSDTQFRVRDALRALKRAKATKVSADSTLDSLYNLVPSAHIRHAGLWREAIKAA